MPARGCGATADSSPPSSPSERGHGHHLESVCKRASAHSQGQDKLGREEWAAPLLYESLSGHPAKAIIYISKGQPHATPSPADVVLPRGPRARRGVLFFTLTAALVVLLLVKIAHMALHHLKHIPSGQELGGIQVIKRHADVKELYMEMEQPIHVNHHPSVTAPAPLRIPRLIHQTYHGQIQYAGGPTYVSRKMLSVGAPGQTGMSWRQHNGHAWEHRFYDDKASLTFVESEYPEYLDAYQALPHASERSDFFRYLVILKYGGVYADIDVECRKPLDSILKPGDSMVVGWDVEVASDGQASERGLVRRRQVLQWFFAAARNHPALREICDHVAAHIRTLLSTDPHRDALERTGPGVWTDIVLRYAQQPSKEGGWSVRILPRSVFGESAQGMDAMSAPNPAMVHHLSETSGSWIDLHRLSYIQMWLAQKVSSFVMREAPPSQEALRSSNVTLFPVSVSFEPSFVMMVDLIGHGDPQSGTDVSAAVTEWGAWQAGAGSDGLRQPTVVEALVGSLASHSTQAALVDVGAGHGFFSLAAAASGHRAVSFEASAPSLAAFRASIAHNSFGALVDVRELPLGVKGPACLRRRGEAGQADAADVNTRRGYGSPAVHGVDASECEQLVQRSTLSEQLMGVTAGSLRLSANGWEGWILQGGEQWLRQHPPSIILIEFSPLLIQRSGYKKPVQILEQLYALGYTEIAHAGKFCEGRWRQLTQPQQVPGAGKTPSHQPTWCRLSPDAFHLFSDAVLGSSIENLLFIHKTKTSKVASRSDGASRVDVSVGSARP